MLEVTFTICRDVTSVHYDIEPRHTAMLADDALVAIPLDGYVHIVETGVVRPTGEFTFGAMYIIEVWHWISASCSSEERHTGTKIPEQNSPRADLIASRSDQVLVESMLQAAPGSSGQPTPVVLVSSGDIVSSMPTISVSISPGNTPEPHTETLSIVLCHLEQYEVGNHGMSCLCRMEHPKS